MALHCQQTWIACENRRRDLADLIEADVTSNIRWRSVFCGTDIREKDCKPTCEAEMDSQKAPTPSIELKSSALVTLDESVRCNHSLRSGVFFIIPSLSKAQL